VVKINGEPQTADGQTVAAYLENQGYDARTIVVELNEVILPKENYAATTLADGDVMEVVCFMGGG
jgi:sulfur carrier protein